MHQTQDATQTSINGLNNTLHQWLAHNGIVGRIDEVLKEQRITRAAVAEVESRVLSEVYLDLVFYLIFLPIIGRLEEYQEINSSRYFETNREIDDLILSNIVAHCKDKPHDSKCQPRLLPVNAQASTFVLVCRPGHSKYSTTSSKLGFCRKLRLDAYQGAAQQ